MGVPKDRVIRLRNDPMETFRQLAFTLMGLFGVIAVVLGVIYLHGDSIDTDFDGSAAASQAGDMPESPPADPLPAAGPAGDDAAPVLNTTLPP